MLRAFVRLLFPSRDKMARICQAVLSRDGVQRTFKPSFSLIWKLQSCGSASTTEGEDR
jgi:hypothetical protein